MQCFYWDIIHMENGLHVSLLPLTGEKYGWIAKIGHCYIILSRILFLTSSAVLRDEKYIPTSDDEW